MAGMNAPEEAGLFEADVNPLAARQKAGRVIGWRGKYSRIRVEGVVRRRLVMDTNRHGRWALGV